MRQNLICLFLFCAKYCVAQTVSDYYIYSIALDSSYSHVPYKYVLVADSTELPKNFLYKVRSVVPSLTVALSKKSSVKTWNEFLKNFTTGNTSRSKLDNKFFTKTKLQFVPNNYNSKVDWPIGNGMMPEVYNRGGINILTPIYYSVDKRKAICAINLLFPEEGEGETLFLFEKHASKWVLVYHSILTVTAR